VGMNACTAPPWANELSNLDDELDNHVPSLRSVACLRVIASRWADGVSPARVNCPRSRGPEVLMVGSVRSGFNNSGDCWGLMVSRHS
jgi:hypothetical protein